MVEYKAEFLLCIGDSGYGQTGECKKPLLLPVQGVGKVLRMDTQEKENN
jgi:hypothetical protein